jgi:1,4-dihydroxy-2-naphthoate octaprenyltransferase
MILKKINYIIKTCNAESEKNMSFVEKWVVSVRACVFSMTITSVLIGALYAVYQGKYNIINTILALIGLLLAHASNNLINDYFDWKLGTDDKNYPRVKYSPHPIVSGLLTEKQLLGGFFMFNFIELFIMIYLWITVGKWVPVFAIAGFLLSVFYVAPPVKLKYKGLGELAIFLIWGPFITAGSYYVVTGTLNLNIFLISIPYGLVVTNVLMGKHLDKYEKDKEKGVKTLPVVLGFKNSIVFTKVITISFFIIITILSVLKILPVYSLIALIAIDRLPRFFKTLSEPKPEAQPENFPIWPLWYVAWAFWFNKKAGGLFIGGLIVGILFNHII